MFCLMMQILLEQRQTSNPKCYWNHIPSLLICFYISVYDFKTNHSPVYACWAVSTEMKIVMSSIEIFIPDMLSSCVFSWTNHHNKDHSREEKKSKKKKRKKHSCSLQTLSLSRVLFLVSICTLSYVHLSEATVSEAKTWTL